MVFSWLNLNNFFNTLHFYPVFIFLFPALVNDPVDPAAIEPVSHQGINDLFNPVNGRCMSTVSAELTNQPERVIQKRFHAVHQYMPRHCPFGKPAFLGYPIPI